MFSRLRSFHFFAQLQCRESRKIALRFYAHESMTHKSLVATASTFNVRRAIYFDTHNANDSFVRSTSSSFAGSFSFSVFIIFDLRFFCSLFSFSLAVLISFHSMVANSMVFFLLCALRIRLSFFFIFFFCSKIHLQ